jgi:hypothetical protein
MKINKLNTILYTILMLMPFLCLAQEYSRNSLKLSSGLSVNEGKSETGFGGILMVGYQKSFWNERLRIGPALTAGSFFPFGITDVRDQYFRITNLSLNGYLDILKYKPVSIFINTGCFMNYTRGLLGSGGWYDIPQTNSDYFFKLYYGGILGCGIRFDQTKKKTAIEISPLNVYFGNNYFVLGFFRIGVDIKLSENKKKIKND